MHCLERMPRTARGKIERSMKVLKEAQQDYVRVTPEASSAPRKKHTPHCVSAHEGVSSAHEVVSTATAYLILKSHFAGLLYYLCYFDITKEPFKNTKYAACSGLAAGRTRLQQTDQPSLDQ